MAKFRVLAWTICCIAGLSSHVAAQGFVWPSGAAPCNATLQQCLDNVGIEPAVVQIDSDTPTSVTTGDSGDLLVTRSVFLIAAPGRRPVFPPGVGIDVVMTTPKAIEIAGLTLRNGRDVNVVAGHESGVGRFHGEHMRFDHVGVAGGGFVINVVGGGDLQIKLRDNDYRRTGGAGNFASVTATAGGIAGEIAFNRIDIPDGTSSAYGILIATAGSNGYNILTVAANRIRGSFTYGAICGVVQVEPIGKLPVSNLRFLENVLTPAQRGVGEGLCLFAGESFLDATIVNNTVVDLGNALRVAPRPFDPPSVVSPIFGEFANNLFAHNGEAVQLVPSASNLSNRNNLFFANTSNGSGYTAHASSSYVDPRLFSRSAPYLLAGSPAINAGINAAWPGPGTWPSLDADGLRRAKGSAIDIGAYEQGDGWFDVLANASTAAGNTLILDHPTTNLAPSARVFATPNFDLGGVPFTAPPGVYWLNANAQWRIFSEDFSGMPFGAGFNVFSPAAPEPSGSFSDIGLFLHRLPATGPTNASTLLDHASTNDRQDAVLMLAQNWNPQDPPASTGIYNNSHVTLQYFADDRWRIANVSGNPIPNGAGFNVYAQPPSPSAFTHTAKPGNITGSSTVLSHPLIDGKPCAKLMATSYFGNGMFDVDYSPARQRWLIYAGNGMLDGAVYHVLFSPRQIEECSGPQLFKDGFE